MSRSGYSDAYDDVLAIGRWRGQVASATRGKRGQLFFKDLLAALDEMPKKRLIAWSLRENGEVCALGALAEKRGIALESLTPDDHEAIAAAFVIAEQLPREVAFVNDEGPYSSETPEERWTRVRDWVSRQIKGAEK